MGEGERDEIEKMTVKNFILLGSAGYIAPRHMKAIHDVGGNLIAAYDPHDSVGVLDQYFPDCAFFTEFERLDRYVEKIGTVDYVSIASPNYLHDAHCRWALRIGADVICEKPLVINERNLDGISRLENGNHAWTVLQLRLHPKVQMFKEKYTDTKWHNVKVNYSTPRGKWYKYSWKGDVAKSGGIATNIGIHLFDLMTWFFGNMKSIETIENDLDCIVGRLILDKAEVHYRLSIRQGEQSQRTFEIDGENIELSNHFETLHSEVYKNILAGNGFGLEETREAIRICEAIRAHK